jgi:hypothetical protein
MVFLQQISNSRCVKYQALISTQFITLLSKLNVRSLSLSLHRLVKDTTHTSNGKHLNEDTKDAFISEENNNKIVEEISQYIEYKTLEDV